ncbi:MAG: prolyl oligopeptidase family serine peptidase [Planctomycetaceae bacterium]
MSVESLKHMQRSVGDHKLHYLVQAPTGKKPEKGWPLLLFLHGYGECGQDIQQVKKHGPPKLITKFEELAHCVIVSPQCPRDSWWRVAALKAVLDEVIEERGDLDKNRLYVTGLSMGGYGIWSFISHHPNYFAAAIPICGGGNPFNLPNNRPGKKKGITNEFLPNGLRQANKLSIWAFHGRRDGSVPIQETETLVKRLKDAGSKKIKFTAYEDAGHVQAWQKAYSNPKTWRWLFSQSSVVAYIPKR